MAKNTFTWRELLTREMRHYGESFADYVGMSPKDGENGWTLKWTWGWGWEVLGMG